MRQITNKQEAVDLILQQEIVAIFQGQSEWGPRALGNRSLLFDPRNKDGKDIVNKIKKREWYRPFAGSCLLEHANDWFEMGVIKESPYMTFAIPVKEEKKSLIPCITHVDGTCRIQTVTKEQNKNFYELIDEFYKITNVPMLFNTSFNLAGEPLVETLDDAHSTIERSDLKYIYLPDLQSQSSGQ
jgi:carbamoyltransferase|tara:strand:+ start:583 stop:1137 length:555 start_codon:yes stop_codon:yes gene_type:complete